MVRETRSERCPVGNHARHGMGALWLHGEPCQPDRLVAGTIRFGPPRGQWFPPHTTPIMVVLMAIVIGEASSAPSGRRTVVTPGAGAFIASGWWPPFVVTAILPFARHRL